MEYLQQFIDIILHMDMHLNAWMTWMGPWLYVPVFLVIFCETGLVVTPFLPGDSFLFALGALAATENSAIDVRILLPLLWVAAVLGDNLNYSIGKFLGPKVFNREDSWLLNKKHLLRAQAFYEEYGAKAIVIARFAPIVRTFAPFVAGIGVMNFPKFLTYNISGGFAWVFSFTLAGYYFGGLPSVKDNFHIVIFAIIGISLLPMVYEFIKAKRGKLSAI